MSVDGIRHRRLRPESAFTIPEQAARFQRERCRPAERPLSKAAVAFTFAACPVLRRSIPARRRYNEAGLPVWGPRSAPDLGASDEGAPRALLRALPDQAHQAGVVFLC